jgi:hypothetical protein
VEPRIDNSRGRKRPLSVAAAHPAERNGVPRVDVEGAQQVLEAAALRRMDAFQAQEVANILHISFGQNLLPPVGPDSHS